MEFFYEERPDAIESATAHFTVTTAKRLRSVLISNGLRPVRGYQLGYRQSPTTGRSLLGSVTQFGADLRVDTAGNMSGTSLPPTVFEYRDGEAGVSRVFSARGVGGYDFSSLRDVALPFDYDGDGRQDLFFYRVDSTLCGALRSLGDGSFSGQVYPKGIAGIKFRETDRVQVLDIDGDGRSDLLVIGPNRACVLRSSGDGRFTVEVYPDFFGYGLNDKDRCLVFDFNGDGRSDVMLYRPDHGKVGIFRSRG